MQLPYLVVASLILNSLYLNPVILLQYGSFWAIKTSVLFLNNFFIALSTFYFTIVCSMPSGTLIISILSVAFNVILIRFDFEDSLIIVNSSP